jgi:phosphohistidine phosphatase
MELILLRHGQAESPLSTTSDFNRALVEKGLEQARNAARVLQAAGCLPQLVLCSPLVRAQQTADAFTLAAGMPGPVTQSWLGCGMSPETALGELAAFPDFQRVMIVGHEPDFSQLVEHLLGASDGSVEVRKGSLVYMEVSLRTGHATLRFLVPFKLAKHLE